MGQYRRVRSLKDAKDFREYVHSLGIALPLDNDLITGPETPLARPYTLRDGFVVGNRFCIHPMEGWDGTDDGRPSNLTERRWGRFGESGAKLIWGGEAVAVLHAGRANPNQLHITEESLPHFRRLRELLIEAHEARYRTSRDLLVGLQLTHSGRFSKPNRQDQPEPIILYHHPLLDRKFGVPDDHPVLEDSEIEKLISRFVDAAELAGASGFDFVDIKHCHGYLGHEFLTAHERPGPFGGSFENRTRFLRQIVDGIRHRVPTMRIGVRVSAFDLPPFRAGAKGRGEPEATSRPYRFAFGANPNDPLSYQLDETRRFLSLLEMLGVELVNLTAGSPYYNPHIQRPASFPPSDGYTPPEDPLVGVARQLEVTKHLKSAFPALAIVGTAYSYLQEWLPHVAQHCVRTGAVDFVGLGRMVLAYPDLPADVLAGKRLDRKRLCRTFSDCTTAPRNGIVSGCFPLDPFYKSRPEARTLEHIKKKR